MKHLSSALPMATVILALAGCAGVQAPQHYFVLEAAAPEPRPQAAAASAPNLLVAPTTAPAFYESQDIVYSRSAGTRSYYQLNSWTEPPSRRLDALLVERLGRSGAFGSVAAATDGVRGRLILTAHLEEMYHDASTSPGTTHIALTAVLSNPANRSIQGQRRFTASAPAATPDAAGAVQGFDVALGPLLDEVVAWAGQAASSTEATPTPAQAALASTAPVIAIPSPSRLEDLP
jgi:cholesterol transport system auxiliary component